MDQLKGIARNLNQITKKANAAGFGKVEVEHKKILAEIKKFLKQVRSDR